MFEGFKTTLRMSQAAACVEGLVVQHGWDRPAWGDPALDANRMVAAIKDQQSAMLEGRKGARPHKFSLAAAALANAAMNTRFRDKQLCLALALGAVLLEVTGKPKLYLLGENDHVLLGMSTQIYSAVLG